MYQLKIYSSLFNYEKLHKSKQFLNENRIKQKMMLKWKLSLSSNLNVMLTIS